jgi:hypothetical protein
MFYTIKKATAVSSLVLVAALAAASMGHAGMRTERFEVPAGKEGYVGDVPMMGEACFKVVSKATNAPARVRFRGLINGKPIDLDWHNGGRCLKFVRDGGIGLYRVYVIPNEDVTVTRMVNEKNHDWRPGSPGGRQPPV